MINNRKLTLLYRSIFITFSFIGIFLSSRILEGTFNTTLFVYYTHLSNILCFVVMLLVLIDNYKKADNPGHNEVIVKLKFAATLAIFITGVVYHFLLGDPSEEGFFSLDNLIVHYIVPFMFVLDWLLFDKKKSITLIDPLTWTAIPLTYLVYALIRGAIVGPDAELQYCYFFIDVNIYGYGGVFLWAIGLTVVFLLVAYLMWVIDKIVKVDGKFKLDFTKDDTTELTKIDNK